VITLVSKSDDYDDDDDDDDELLVPIPVLNQYS